MLSNRRRSHVHFIHQYKADNNEYIGSRVVIFRKKQGGKEIRDIGNFIIHEYKNPKSKKNKASQWSIKECELEDVIKKEMINTSIDNKYKMHHVLYESPSLKLEDYLDKVIQIEFLEE